MSTITESIEQSIGKKSRIHHGENTRMFRKMRNWDQGELAERAGISQSSISNYEKDEKLADDVIEKLAKALGIDPIYIKEKTQDDIFSYFIGNLNGAGSTNIVGNDIDTCHIHPLNKISELYDALLKEKQEQLDFWKGQAELYKAQLNA